MSWFKQSRVKDPAYLKYMGNLPCLVSGTTNATVGHHLLKTGLRGVGLKSPDNFLIPLAVGVHNQLHASGNEDKWFAGWGITNQIAIANRLYELYQNKDYNAMTTLLQTREL